MVSPIPHLIVMTIGTGACVAAMLAACSVLTPAEDAGLYAADVAACTALSELPTVGPIVALVCPNEEAFAKAALDHAVAEGAKDAGALDAGVGVAVAAMTAAPTSEPRVAVTRRGKRGKRRLVMYAPKSLADGCQRYADAASVDGGGA